MTNQPTPLTDAQLAEYEALDKAATPGPWHLTDSGAIVAPLTGIHVADVWEPTAESRNGEFIEAARAALPALVAETHRLRAAPSMLCINCETPVGWIDCPTGGWWAHDTHPADGHDADPKPAPAARPAPTA